MSDLVEQLRVMVAKSDSQLWGTGATSLMAEAANEIERLHAELQRAKANERVYLLEEF